ncbi:bifunctional [glutamine synthetase] adenylyltransferase/[glutamine synthetase]-adenylyl-L-tyrosine phosphorylase [Solicola sp. PLA-1-18]|uniref:bifunctional [glutamine synthetase] adenylyltransferase/[glutamine synthetase]-adenylyl-L-tyrosine phosphorylase n=1 Tax=Solicola sp. PLA-1-18 TaxID=3380532 RepID=UPI003B8024D4
MPSTGFLSRLGFTARDAADALEVLGDVPDETLQRIARAADPDWALATVVALAGLGEPGAFVQRLVDDPQLTENLALVTGLSEALGTFLVRHPDVVDDLSAARLSPSPRDAAELAELFDDVHDPDALRVAYHRALVSVAARDLVGLVAFEQTAAELADLAAVTLSASLRIAQEKDPDAADACRLAVIAMGKTGGRELNYVSDVDVVFVHETPEGGDDDRARRAATRLAGAMMRHCSERTAEGTIWEVDANLRPEGKTGPLTRTLDSHVAYYERWARTWEFQALLKARPVAGDTDLGQAYVDALSPMVWEASTRPHFVEDTRAMRRRVVDHIPADRIDRELKLGPGGLRDVEFAVQLLQLVHGRADDRIRAANTMAALDALTEHGYVGRQDGARMREAYDFLRTLEHRIQLTHLRRTHLVPDDPDELRRLGRSMGFRGDPGENLVKEWRANGREVGRLHHKLYYRPLLEAVASLPADGLRLTTDAAQARLVALGYSDPRGALAHISALTSGVSRRASILRNLLPAMLAWFAEAPDPDAGLLAFRRISDSLGSSHWFLRKLRDEDEGAAQLAHVLASSAYVTDLLLRAPESVAMLGHEEELRPRGRESLLTEMHAAAGRHEDAAEAVRAVRRVRRRELSRVGIADVLDRLDVVESGRALSDVSIATLSASLAAASRAAAESRGGELPTRMAIVVMGRLGGHEVGYGSDADVMFVHEPVEGAEEKEASTAALWIAAEVRRTLALPAGDPALAVDADLRPEGRQGPLVRSLASYAAYYERWSAVWEAQALLRADPVIGDEGLRERFGALIDPLRWPEAGTSPDDVREVRRIKARIDAERLPRGANRATHLKLGRGGLADVEWTVQLLQMQHAHEVPGLRTTETIAALRAACEAGLVTEPDAEALEHAWRIVSRIRNAVVLMRSRPAESMVEQNGDRAGVAYLMGYRPDETERMVDDYLRATRHAHAVVERVFWG